eukprot:jgi/Mesvir1/4870/Mv11140-RA.1
MNKCPAAGIKTVHFAEMAGKTDSMEAQVAAIKHGEEATAPPNQFATVYREDPFWAPMPGDVEINAAEATKGKQARSPLSFSAGTHVACRAAARVLFYAAGWGAICF